MPARPGMEEARVPVPLGAGVDDGTDEFLLEAPFSAVVEDMRPDKAGMYRKRPGWTEVHDPSGTSVDAVLVGGPTSVLVCGTDGDAVTLAPGRDKETIGFGAPAPMFLETFRLSGGNGFIHSVQVASSGTYHGVITLVNGSGPPDSLAEDQRVPERYSRAEVRILDEDLRTVWGPHVVDTIQALPRVEAVSATRFVFFGTSFATSVGGNGAFEPGAAAPQLCFTQGVVGGAAPAATTPLGYLYPSSSSGALGRANKMYDTCSSWPYQGSTSRVFVAWPEDNGVDRELHVSAITSLGVVDADVVTLPDSPHESGHVACGYYDGDGAPGRLAVYHALLGVLGGVTPSSVCFTWNASGLNLGDTVAGIAAPAGMQTAYDFACDAGPLGVMPVFYYAPDGSFRLNEMTLVVTAGTAAVTGTDDPPLPMLCNPVSDGARNFYFWASGRESAIVSFTVPGAHPEPYKPPGGTTLEIYHLDPQHPDGVARPVIDATVGESRWGTWGHPLYTHRNWNGPVQGWSPHVTGQVGTDSEGRWIVPAPFLTSRQHPRGEVDAEFLLAVNVGAELDGRQTANTAGAGFWNDEQVLALVRVTREVPTYAAVPYEDSVLLAAGMVSSWSGQQVHAAAMRPPVVSSLTATDVSRSVGPSFVGVLSLSSNSYNPRLDYTAKYYYCVVLVLTDAAGIEHRSAPSELVEGISLADTGAPSPYPLVGLLPVLSLNLHPQVLAMVGAGRSLDAEVYVTTRWATNVEPGPTAYTEVDTETFTMVNRMPVQRDVDGYYVLDTLQDLAGGLDGTAVVRGWSNPPHVTPLYTLAEAPAAHPPAMHVLAQAGNYLFGVAGDDAYEVWFSKPLTKGLAPEWSPLLTFQAPSTSGGVISLAGTYDRLFLICRDGVWEMPALDGPDAAGSGTFPAARLVYRGERCVGHAGTVQTPRGTFYITPSGPHLLSDSGDADIGRRVEDQIDWTDVRAAVYRPTTDEVSWFTDTGSCHLALGSMAFTTSAAAARAAARVDDDLYVVWGTGVGATPDGSVYIEDRDSHRDPSAIVSPTSPAYILGRVVSPWFSLGDAHGFKRFVGVSILGRLNTTPTRGRLTVTLAYDYVDTEVDTFTWTAAELAALGKGLQLLVKPSRQKTTAVRVTIYESTWAPGLVEVGSDIPTDLDWSLVRLELRVRTKTGLLKLEQGAKQ